MGTGVTAMSKIGWFCKRTWTSVDDGARCTNSQIWSNLNRIQTIPRAHPTLSNVPVLLLNQSNNLHARREVLKYIENNCHRAQWLALLPHCLLVEYSSHTTQNFRKSFIFPKKCFYFVLFLEENAISVVKFLSYMSLHNWQNIREGNF